MVPFSKKHGASRIPHLATRIPHLTFYFLLSTFYLLPPNLAAQSNQDEAQLAIRFYQAREYEKALELYQKLYNERPSSYYYMYYLHSLIELKEFREARKLIKSQQKIDPQAVKYMVDLGYLQYREGHPDRAEKYYQEAVDALQADQHQINALANAFIMKGIYEYAIQTYLKGRELLENTYPFSLELANVYQRTGNEASLFDEYLNLLAYKDSYLRIVQDRLQPILADDPDNEKNEQFRIALLKRVQEHPEVSVYADLLWWYSVQQKDFELALIQTKALDRRRQEQGDRILQLAQLASANEQYTIAREAYEYLLSKGEDHPYHQIARIEYENTRFMEMTSGPEPDQKEVEAVATSSRKVLESVGLNRLSVSLVQNLAHLEAFYLDRPDVAIELLNRAISLPDLDPKQRALCKLEQGDIELFFNDVWEATLLYQQVYRDFKYDLIGQIAKFKNTRLSYFIGEFNWAKAQADILKASTDKLIANDALALSILIGENVGPDSNTMALEIYARADKQVERKQYQKAIQVLDSIPSFFNTHPIFDDILLKKAEIYLQMGSYAMADSLLFRVASEYPDDVLADRALFMQAQLQEKQLQNPEKAKELYLRLLKRYPGSIYVVDARKRIRALRGDLQD